MSNEPRSLLREYYPAFLAAFAGGTATNLATADARAVLAIAPTPTQAAELTKASIAAALHRGGRKREADRRAAEIHSALRHPQLRHDQVVEDTFGAQTLRLLATLTVECDSVDQLGEATTAAFQQHPDYAIITSYPGLGDVTSARVLAELGDDRARLATAHDLKAYAGSAPVTRTSGRSLSITHRRVKNNRLAAAGWVWAFLAFSHSPGCRTHYDHRRKLGDRHAAALRHLFNRLLGCLYHCLQTGHSYDEKGIPRPRNHTRTGGSLTPMTDLRSGARYCRDARLPPVTLHRRARRRCRLSRRCSRMALPDRSLGGRWRVHRTRRHRCRRARRHDSGWIRSSSQRRPTASAPQLPGRSASTPPTRHRPPAHPHGLRRDRRPTHGPDHRRSRRLLPVPSTQEDVRLPDLPA